MSVCKSIRHGSQFQLSVFHQPAVVFRTRQLRGLSTYNVPLSLRIPQRSTLLRVPEVSSRKYWWSSRATASPPPDVAKAVQSEPVSAPSTPLPEVASEPSISSIATSEPVVVNNESLIASVPDIPIDTIPPAALQWGDLKELGFCNYSPVGAAQAALEAVQVTTGLPWWGTIVLTTILVRFAIVPFAIKSARVAGKTVPLRPQMDKLMTEVKEAKLAGDRMRLQVAAIKLQNLRKTNGLSFGGSLAGPFSQAVVSIAMFIGLKRLSDYPLAQLKFESIGWLPSLTAPDPLYILPSISFAVMNLQIHLGKAESAAAGAQVQHFANGFRVLSLLFLPLIAKLPAGLMIYLVTNVGLLAIQSSLLRLPAVRRALDIPPLVKPTSTESPSMKDTWDALLAWFRSQKQQAQQKAMERTQADISMFPARPPTPITRRNVRPALRRKT